MTLRQNLKHNFFETSNNLFRFSFVTLFIFLIARIFEYHFAPEKGLFPHTLLHVVINDVLFSFILFAYCFIPAFIINLLAPTFMRVLFLFIYALIIIFHICLLTFFFNSNVMLGSEIYGYTMKEIIFTANASGGLNIWIITFFVVALIIYFLLTYFTRRFFNSMYKLITCILFIIAVAIFFTKSITQSKA